MYEKSGIPTNRESILQKNYLASALLIPSYTLYVIQQNPDNSFDQETGSLSQIIRIANYRLYKIKKINSGENLAGNTNNRDTDYENSTILSILWAYTFNGHSTGTMRI